MGVFEFYLRYTIFIFKIRGVEDTENKYSKSQMVFKYFPHRISSFYVMYNFSLSETSHTKVTCFL